MDPRAGDSPDPDFRLAVRTWAAAGAVRADQGPWQRAELAADVSIDTWRMWRTVLPLTPGAHVLQVRATDGTGTVQTPTVASTVPDGATGWHTVTVTAS
jgi:hypothetical protein